MPEHDKPDPERPSLPEAEERILALMDDDALLHAVVECGGDDTYWYYIAVLNEGYEGREYLKERYVQLVQPHAAENRDDTFKTNGINRRVEGDLPSFSRILARVYGAVEKHEKNLANGRWDVEDVPTVRIATSRPE